MQPRDMQPAIVLTEVSKQYPSATEPAVRDVEISISAGEIVALLGPSGCGKTTTLRIIAGFERPDTGAVAIAGQLVADANGTFVPPERRGVGMVFQDYALFPHLTVADNISFGLGRMPAGERRERVAELLALTGLGAVAQRYPHQLSGGQQQRVAIARALHARPAVLFADEPTGALDRSSGRQVLRLMRSLADVHRQTVVMVTHDPLAASYAHAVIFLADGQIVGQSRGADATQIAATMTELER